MPRNSNIKKVALNVIEQSKRGERPNIGKAMREAGYSLITSKANPTRIKKNPVFIKTIQSFESRLDRVIDIGLDIIEKKKGKATFRDGIEATEKMTKLKRLVTGQSTENVATSISSVLDLLENPVQTDNKESE